jgi:flagellar motor component MotA
MLYNCCNLFSSKKELKAIKIKKIIDKIKKTNNNTYLLEYVKLVSELVDDTIKLENNKTTRENFIKEYSEIILNGNKEQIEEIKLNLVDMINEYYSMN